MNLIHAAIYNPVKVTVGVMLVVLFGLVGLMRMPIQLAPEVEIPRISIRTAWLGANPAEIEREIIEPQEEQLNTVEGVTKMHSQCRNSEGSIVLEFPVGTNIDSALVLVNAALQQVKQYPANADRPVISKVDSVNNRPIAWFMLRPLPEYEGKIDMETLLTFTENEVEAEFEKVPGVAESNTRGGREKRLEVIIDPQQLAARQITIGQLREALINENRDVSGGDLREGKRGYAVRTLGQFRSPEQVEQVIIARRDGQPVYVRDVATVQIGYKQPLGLVRQRGRTTISLNVLRATGSNVLEVMAGVKDKVKELNAGILKDNGLEIVQVYDETEYINGAIGLVESNILIGSFLTVGVLLLFLRSIWPTLVIALAIPTSIIGTFFLFSTTGRTLNVVSLAGLAFAVGMVVDNAIVVMENIYRHFQMGKNRLQAALDGATEVWGAVLASTLTTLAVFVPVIFVQEEAGQLFRDISIAISCAVGLSLVVGMTVIPTASARILRRSDKAAFDADDNPRGFSERISRFFVAVNRYILSHRVYRIATVAGGVFLSVIGSYLLWPSVEYLPEGNRNLIVGLLLPPPGYNIDQMTKIGERVESRLKQYWTVDGTEAPAAKERGIPSIDHFFFIASGGQLFIGVKSSQDQRAAELIPIVREAVSAEPGMIPVIVQTSLFEGALEGGRSIDIEITGDRLDRLVAIGQKVFDQINAMSKDPDNPLYESQMRPIPSLDLSNPEIHVVPHKEQAADLGISVAALGYSVDALIDGAYAGDYFDRNEKIDLEIVGQKQYATRTQDLEQLYLGAEGGELIPLSTVADVSLGSGPEQIHRRGRRRAITIQIKPPISTPLEIARQLIEEQIVEPLRTDPITESGRFRVVTAGTADKLTQAWSAMGFNLFLALMITYLLLAGLFKSFLFPLVIMVSVPLAAVGGFGGLALCNLFTTLTLDRVTSLDILTMLGFVILIGTVVNNAILIVHQSLQLIHHEGYALQDAVLESTRTRVRPIFMTTMTTLLGLLPLVIMPGSGSEIYRGLGSVVLGGLLISTLFTLILAPSLFMLLMEMRQGLAHWLFPHRPDPDPNGPAWSLDDDGSNMAERAEKTPPSLTTAVHGNGGYSGNGGNGGTNTGAGRGEPRPAHSEPPT